VAAPSTTEEVESEGWPISAAVAGAQHLLELAVEALHHIIRLGLVSCLQNVLNPSFWHSTVHTALVNCGPLSDVMRAGVAKRATQPPMMAFAQAWAKVETIGMASIHLEDLSSTGRREGACTSPVK
jgi:hypothetical protein